MEGDLMKGGPMKGDAMQALFVTMDAGGNLPPALGIAGEITRRGGRARFVGHEPQRTAVEAAGFRFETFTQGRAYDSAAPRSTVSGVRDLTAVFADRKIGRDAVRLAHAEPTDVVIVDCLLIGALKVLTATDLPTVSLVHTLWSFFQGETHGPIGAILRLRGLPMRRVLESPGLSLVTVRDEFEPPGTRLAPGVHHVGVVWQGIPRPARPATGRRRVLISLSSTRFPGQHQVLQSILDAVDGLDLDVVVTTGPAVDPAVLRAPATATVHRYLDHAQVMPEVDLVVGHGGHSTTARALSYGLPLLILPMHPLMDQAAVGAAVARLGAGRVLARSAKPALIRDALLGILGADRYRTAAGLLGESIRQHDGAGRAVDLLETFLSAPRRAGVTGRGT